MSCKLLQMLVIPHKMTAGPRKMTAELRKMTAAPRKMTAAPRKMTSTPRKMTAATHLMFAKVCPGPRGPPPTPILEKTLVSRNDFKDIRNKKNKNIKRKKNFHPD